MTLIAAASSVDSAGRGVFSLQPFDENIASGEIGLKQPAPKEQPPRKLSGKRTAR
jgi:hypothetical protein